MGSKIAPYFGKRKRPPSNKYIWGLLFGDKLHKWKTIPSLFHSLTNFGGHQKVTFIFLSCKFYTCLQEMEPRSGQPLKGWIGLGPQLLENMGRNPIKLPITSLHPWDRFLIIFFPKKKT
jgi:hypothetical protein